MKKFFSGFVKRAKKMLRQILLIAFLFIYGWSAVSKSKRKREKKEVYEYVNSS